MGIKPINYNEESSSKNWYDGTTPGADVNGDGKADNTSVNLTQDNAQFVVKDVAGGRTDLPTAELMKAQNGEGSNDARATFLAKYTEDDEIQYSDEEAKNIGQNKIDTNDANNEGSTLNAVGQGAAGIAASAGSAASVYAGLEILSTILTTVDGTIALAIAGAETAITGGLLAASLTFDPNLKNRESETGKAEENNATIQSYSDLLADNVGLMGEESAIYEELSGEFMDSNLEFINEKTDLQSELLVLQAQGDSDGIKRIKEQIKNLEESSEEGLGSQEEELNVYKDNLSQYHTDIMEADGVKESGTNVAKFLNAGNAMGIMAYICGGLSFGAGILCGVCAAVIFPKWLFDTPMATAAKVLMGVSAALCLAAGGVYMSKGSKEMKASEAGTTMDGYIETLDENIGSSGDAVEENTGIYSDVDEEVNTGIAEGEEKAGEALNKQEENISKDNKFGALTSKGSNDTSTGTSESGSGSTSTSGISGGASGGNA